MSQTIHSNFGVNSTWDKCVTQILCKKLTQKM